jgi:hypothetical protein
MDPVSRGEEAQFRRQRTTISGFLGLETSRYWPKEVLLEMEQNQQILRRRADLPVR